MPKTKLEELVYGLLMTLFMVLAMELYNTGLRMGELTNAGILARASITVAFMCPIMSFWATVIFKRPGWEFVPCWLQTVACNFPMAFFWQIFFCGPLVQFLFRLLFRRGKTSSAAQIQLILFLPIKMPRTCRFSGTRGAFFVYQRNGQRSSQSLMSFTSSYMAA